MKWTALRGIGLALVMGLVPTAALALSPDTKDPVAIMQAMNDRDVGNRATGTMTIVVEDAAGRSRTRVLTTRTLKSQDGKVTWQRMRFDSPADVRGTTLLTHDFEDGAKQDDQWLYLPSLKKPTQNVNRNQTFPSPQPGCCLGPGPGIS